MSKNEGVIMKKIITLGLSLILTTGSNSSALFNRIFGYESKIQEKNDLINVDLTEKTSELFKSISRTEKLKKSSLPSSPFSFDSFKQSINSLKEFIEKRKIFEKELENAKKLIDKLSAHASTSLYSVICQTLTQKNIADEELDSIVTQIQKFVSNSHWSVGFLSRIGIIDRFINKDFIKSNIQTIKGFFGQDYNSQEGKFLEFIDNTLTDTLSPGIWRSVAIKVSKYYGKKIFSKFSQDAGNLVPKEERDAVRDRVLDIINSTRQLKINTNKELKTDSEDIYQDLNNLLTSINSFRVSQVEILQPQNLSFFNTNKTLLKIGSFFDVKDFRTISLRNESICIAESIQNIKSEIDKLANDIEQIKTNIEPSVNYFELLQ